MRIIRTEKRIAAAGTHQFFLDNHQLWLDLRAGKIIEIPNDLYESIQKIYGNSIKVVVDEVNNEKDILKELDEE